MIIPQYWAEARRRERTKNRQITVRRFGWSDISQEDAQQHAQSRVDEAFERIVAGENLVRREPKVAYNGAQGVPIREEIVERYNSAVVTRNLYGARCLNTPDVLFADIDLELQINVPSVFAAMTFLLVVSVVIGWQVGVWQLGLVLAILSLPAGYFLVAGWQRLQIALVGGAAAAARRRIERFVTQHPEWHLRLYRTPAGWRLMALQQKFDPHDPAVKEMFAALQVDPLYARMCLNQNCFRARVSPKPWRIGIDRHIRPQPGIWPVAEDRLAQRQEWIDNYEQIARGFAACQYVETFGSHTLDPDAAEVQRIHDELCQANRNLEIA